MTMALPLQFSGVYRFATSAAEMADSFVRRMTNEVGLPLYNHGGFVLFGGGGDRWPGANCHQSSTGITVILGEPVLVQERTVLPRSDALPLLDEALSRGTYSGLANTHGTYCGINYNRARARLHLFTDKIGVRGLFVAEIDGVLLFATNDALLLRLVEPFSAIDYTAGAETLAFGHALGDRTRLRECKRLREAEIVRCVPGRLSRCQYHRWTASINTSPDLESAADKVNQVFLTAVEDRLAAVARPQQFAFLSGGMDSRLIVNTLLACGKRPITLNVAPAETQDALLGARAAADFGTNHHAFPATSVWMGLAMDRGVERVQSLHADHNASLWWSGDGGSVGLGHVYLTERSCPRDPTGAATIARELIEHNTWRVPQRPLKPKWSYLCELPIRGMVDEMQRYEHLPPEKRAYAFLLFNNQQRHLDYHYRSLRDRSHDLILPFFDSRVIQAIFELPTEYFLYHRLYDMIFARSFSPDHKIPWQVYPGHVPCPFPDDAPGRYQWDSWSDRSSIRSARREAARQAVAMILRGQMAPPVRSMVVLAAAFATYSGIKDLQYILESARILSAVVQD
jgi:asparagine synthase (glutamine-hydrolysing)